MLTKKIIATLQGWVIDLKGSLKELQIISSASVQLKEIEAVK